MSDVPWIQPVVLEGRIVRLEPLRHDHLDGLAEVAFDPGLWQWTQRAAEALERAAEVADGLLCIADGPRN